MRTFHLSIKEEIQGMQVHLKYTHRTPKPQSLYIKKNHYPATNQLTDPSTKAHSRSTNSKN